MTIRLYVDEDSSDKDLLQALRARGVDVIPANEVDMVERDDEEHLRFATARGRAPVGRKRLTDCARETREIDAKAS